MPLDTPGPLLDHCCLHSLGVGPRRWFRVDQGGPQWSTVVQRAPEGKTNILTFLLMWGGFRSTFRGPVAQHAAQGAPRGGKSLSPSARCPYTPAPTGLRNPSG